MLLADGMIRDKVSEKLANRVAVPAPTSLAHCVEDFMELLVSTGPVGSNGVALGRFAREDRLLVVAAWLRSRTTNAEHEQDGVKARAWLRACRKEEAWARALADLVRWMASCGRDAGRFGTAVATVIEYMTDDEVVEVVHGALGTLPLNVWAELCAWAASLLEMLWHEGVLREVGDRLAGKGDEG